MWDSPMRREWLLGNDDILGRAFPFQFVSRYPHAEAHCSGVAFKGSPGGALGHGRQCQRMRCYGTSSTLDKDM